MTPATSVFLDVLRLAAALTVFLAHTATYWNPALVGPMQHVAHQAVVVFFVLSGYVVAHATRRTGDAATFAAARLSRLYSVVVPALLLTAACWPLGRELDPALYAAYAKDGAALRYVASGLFLNETWFLNAYPPSNTPFWSLGYEGWYYVLAGVVAYVGSWRWKILLLALCGVLAGPKVLLLLPVWLAGVAAFLARGRMRMPRTVSAVGLVLCSGAAWYCMSNLPDIPAPLGAEPWFFSGRSGSDALIGLILGLMIWFFDHAFATLPVHSSVLAVIRNCASHTFSLYLYHAPLVILSVALVPPLGMSLQESLLVMGAILLVIVILGAITEGMRDLWRRAISRLFEVVARSLRR